MKILLAIIFLLVFGEATAQVIPPCLPSTVSGTGTKHVYVEDSVGFYLAWYCPSVDKRVEYWAHWTDMPSAWRKQAADALASGTASQLGSTVTPCNKAPNGGCYTPADLDNVIQPGWKQLQALLPPPPSGFVVQTPLFGTNVTVYSVVNGKRGPALSGIFSHAGDPCDPTITISEGSVRYMSVQGGIGVSVCVSK